jgi:hypothetical protein
MKLNFVSFYFKIALFLENGETIICSKKSMEQLRGRHIYRIMYRIFRERNSMVEKWSLETERRRKNEEHSCTVCSKEPDGSAY